MTEAEARAAVETMRGHVDNLRRLAWELYSREGWRALGYRSWRDCIAAEFDASRSHIYRQLQAALIEAEVSPNGDIGAIPEGRLRPLAELPPGERRPAWELAAEAAGGEPTGKQVAATVRELRPAPAPKATSKPAPRPEPEPARDDPAADEPENLLADDEPEACGGRSIVNGVEQDDPPEIAESRRKGAIPAGVVPVVETNDPVPLLPPSREPGEDDDATDDVDEWVETLPLYRRLSDRPHKLFVHAAKLYWRLRPHREAFRAGASDALRGLTHDNELAFLLKAYLRIGDPKFWPVCPPTAEGGCDGLGQIPGIDEKCPLCRGRGFRCREAR